MAEQEQEQKLTLQECIRLAEKACAWADLSSVVSGTQKIMGEIPDPEKVKLHVILNKYDPQSGLFRKNKPTTYGIRVSGMGGFNLAEHGPLWDDDLKQLYEQAEESIQIDYERKYQGALINAKAAAKRSD